MTGAPSAREAEYATSDAIAEITSEEMLKSANSVAVGTAGETAPPIWEVGAGLGFVHFEQYPAAGRYTDLLLPFPTFQYRGETLRADDREGAKAYLLRDDRWTLELSGTGSAALDSDQNTARNGMKDIPWIIALGPEFVYKLNSQWQLSFGVYQAMMTDFQWTAFSGAFVEQSLKYKKDDIWGSYKSLLQLGLQIKSASREVQEKYFAVSTSETNADRAAYRAKGGYLSTEISYYQSLKKNKWSYYWGLTHEIYSSGANAKSPLYKSNSGTQIFLGITYVLKQSSKPQVDESGTTGIINQLLPPF